MTSPDLWACRDKEQEGTRVSSASSRIRGLQHSRGVGQGHGPPGGKSLALTGKHTTYTCPLPLVTLQHAQQGPALCLLLTPGSHAGAFDSPAPHRANRPPWQERNTRLSPLAAAGSPARHPSLSGRGTRGRPHHLSSGKSSSSRSPSGRPAAHPPGTRWGGGEGRRHWVRLPSEGSLRPTQP